ncbi:hypothetical protein L198_00840 [Cryptococcus wingfieldii CBS 7118]|uniref:Mannosyltransferase n=1 Tax=Cryptococcus wingfieldii CBS 7118 TaxID=1295528 RepID=A0A1E3K2M2_9TREE|nr:hypothetical protein L198_00840 [Cryptococcus wingfieldii CBS 7118]ODO07261.1 hypothetical protein L198_00840 [Cryptococcus wingfieldii CBS 7118]
MPAPPPSPLPPNRKSLTLLLSSLPFLITFTHIFLSPYTKVEESFTLHAVHDVLAYGFWDHITFPGAVPRSFLPPILLGLITYPFSALFVALGVIKTKIGVQLLIRLILASFFSLSFNHLAASLQIVYGTPSRVWFTLLSLGTFHTSYYAGRTLPNFTALPGVLWSISQVIRSESSPTAKEGQTQLRNAIIILTALATIVRLELALFVLPLALSLVVLQRATIGQVIQWGLIGGFGSLAITSPIDYTLWLPALSHPDFPFNSPSQLLWPELSSIIYNALEGHSEEWGIMPFHYYFTNSIPKLLVGNFALVGLAGGLWASARVGGQKLMRQVGCWDKSRAGRGVGRLLTVWGLSISSVLVGLSALGHKEWRFILPILPILHIISALSASNLWSLPPPSSYLRPLARLAVLGLLAVNLLATGVMTFLSVNNYPGGEVWQALEAAGVAEGEKIWFPSYPLQTGATLFTFTHDHAAGQGLAFWPALPAAEEPRWVYDKSEGVNLSNSEWMDGVDFVVTGDWAGLTEDGWEMVAEVGGLEGVGKAPGQYKVEARWGRKLAILKKD